MRKSSSERPFPQGSGGRGRGAGVPIAGGRSNGRDLRGEGSSRSLVSTGSRGPRASSPARSTSSKDSASHPHSALQPTNLRVGVHVYTTTFPNTHHHIANPSQMRCTTQDAPRPWADLQWQPLNAAVHGWRASVGHGTPHGWRPLCWNALRCAPSHDGAHACWHGAPPNHDAVLHGALPFTTTAAVPARVCLGRHMPSAAHPTG